MGFIEFNEDTGLIVKTKANIINDLKNIFAIAYGQDYQIIQGTELYSLIDLLSTELAETGSAAKAIYDAFGFTSAAGTPLDAICSIAGISRKEGESDTALRARYYTALYKNSVGTVEGIKARLLSHTFINEEGTILNSVTDVRVYNNTSSTAITVKQENDFAAHSIAVVCKLNEVLTSDKSYYSDVLSELSNIVDNYKSLGCGVSLADISQSIALVERVNIDLTINLSTTSLSDDEKNSFLRSLNTNVKDYVNNLEIGENLIISGIYKCVYDTASQLQLKGSKCPKIESIKYKKSADSSSILLEDMIEVKITEQLHTDKITCDFGESE